MSKQTSFPPLLKNPFIPCSFYSGASPLLRQVPTERHWLVAQGVKINHVGIKHFAVVHNCFMLHLTLPFPLFPPVKTLASLPPLITVLEKLQSCLFSHYEMISPIKPPLSDIFTQSFLLHKSGSLDDNWTAFEEKKSNDLGEKSLAVCSLIINCPIILVTLMQKGEEELLMIYCPLTASKISSDIFLNVYHNF